MGQDGEKRADRKGFTLESFIKVRVRVRCKSDLSQKVISQ